ncbi:hypothetical protein HAX54_044227 [Datura stramonium]|uniref:Uncharacterized protein n=1 Tax=Datura stramonium TaxID=4076 RepID=A0ABS8SP97_DATST|nr:hypothetical protein [Datura stramonium]
MYTPCKVGQNCITFFLSQQRKSSKWFLRQEFLGRLNGNILRHNPLICYLLKGSTQLFDQKIVADDISSGGRETTNQVVNDVAGNSWLFGSQKKESSKPQTEANRLKALQRTAA